jgi:hypothetical protein
MDNDEPEKQSISLDLVRALKADLRSFSPRPSISIRQLVVQIRSEILEAKRNGATWSDIASLLATRGVDAPPDTIRQYCRAASPSRPLRAMRRRPDKATNTTANRETAELPHNFDPSDDPVDDGGMAATEITARGRPVVARRLT